MRLDRTRRLLLGHRGEERQGAARRLTDDPRSEFTPSWSPDGSRVVYRVEALEEQTDADIWVVDADGGGKLNLTDTPRQAEWSPAWSPDGTRIADFSAKAEGGDIYVMRPDGFGRWSPDGRRITFVSDRSGSRELYTMKPDGSGVRRLTNPPTANENYPSWTADGHIAFLREEGDLFRSERWVVAPDGSAPRRLLGPGNVFSHMSWTQRADTLR